MENNKTVKIVFATGNPHKLQEINEISKDSGVEFILPPAGFDPIENFPDVIIYNANVASATKRYKTFRLNIPVTSVPNIKNNPVRTITIPT